MNPLQRQLIETGLATPAEIAFAQVQASHDSIVEQKLEDWHHSRYIADEERWLPVLESMMRDLGIGHAIRFASKLEDSSPVIQDWLIEVCERLR